MEKEKNKNILKWIKENLFNGVWNSFLTIFICFLLFKFMVPFFKWAFIDSSFFSLCTGKDGACWAVITKNIRFILFGFYPYEIQWRPACSISIFFILIVLSLRREYWKKQLAFAWLAGLLGIWILMRGGLFGLTSVESDLWGGLPLTLILAVFGIAFAYPIGVILALGRRSKMPAVKYVCILYIEMIRGVPLISLLFMSSIIFPMFLPQGVTINKILRAQLAISLFFAAYVAEVVRGGLQAIPKDQYEAADSLGLSYYNKMRLVILPQALKIVIPPTVNTLIAALKDTSLVTIIALFDILMTTKSVISNPRWMGFSVEAYLFIAVIYFLLCYSMSKVSGHLEADLKRFKN